MLQLRNWPPGRWFVVLSLLTGAFFLVQQALGGADLYVAFLKAVGAAAALMVLAGLAQRLWEGHRMEGAQLPGAPALSSNPSKPRRKPGRASNN